MSLGDAIRGTDDPRWRVAPVLTMPKYLVDKFKIVSVPHLLFKEDAVTNRMLKLPNGEALKYYKAILPTCKMAFPNQNATVHSRQKGKYDQGPNAALMIESADGVRAQLNRAERVFASLLEQLENQDASQLPSTREEWMTFIDAGATVLDLYATLAYGFMRGGSKVAQAYETSITTKGLFDPVKLWPDESQFRRKTE
jgi:hypothetical protein